MLKCEKKTSIQTDKASITAMQENDPKKVSISMTYIGEYAGYTIEITDMQASEFAHDILRMVGEEM